LNKKMWLPCQVRGGHFFIQNWSVEIELNRGSHRGRRSRPTGVSAKLIAHLLAPTIFSREKCGFLADCGEAILFDSASRILEKS